MAARLCLNVAHICNTTTFKKPGYGETIPAIRRDILDWKVVEDSTVVDRPYLLNVSYNGILHMELYVIIVHDVTDVHRRVTTWI